MGISQRDRDRIEDLGLDPQSDHTEDLHPRNAKTPGCNRGFAETEPNHHLKGSSR
ncbi:Uncharacterised protein [Mycobacteroides abscessus subsp. abscessus]|uniref:hypothetical protein n=1 Tax=Mycobacteroides abscessus TaxID=36809 RepID=UPI000927AF6C|nr:hypothetical protein [Mycobacteroides abscessus]SHQ38284.1 Uncharacterised protein [Mycobacteroides abscessus subsp. abscessus]SIN50326.1 Uncharacterised protein [Mycobacteroides abscessus subsp. bolletii]SKI24089.1 Uncharacterised protein [Mycobacteroides abscessus subsp. massiliense]MBE5430508.1 hypothetical protein [Mycobacteroides abscessus]